MAVKVERRKCSACGTCAWASDDWRNTMVFNYDNDCLVEISLMYECLTAFVSGTPIQNFFSANFAPLMDDLRWLSRKENEVYAARCEESAISIFL